MGGSFSFSGNVYSGRNLPKGDLCRKASPQLHQGNNAQGSMQETLLRNELFFNRAFSYTNVTFHEVADQPKACSIASVRVPRTEIKWRLPYLNNWYTSKLNRYASAVMYAT